MTDPVEPPGTRAETAERMFFDTIALDLEHVERARAAEAERDEARRLLEAALLDLLPGVGGPPDFPYMPGELPDEIRAFLAGTTTEEQR